MDSDLESGGFRATSPNKESDEATTRKLSKTLGAVTVQLVTTFLIALWCRKSETFINMPPDQATGLIWGMFFAMIITMVLAFVFVYCKSFIGQLVAFTGFTLSMSVLVAVAIVGYDAQVLLQAFAITMGISIYLTAYVLITKKDFTSLYGVLGVALWGLILASFIFIFFPPSNTVQIVYACIGIVVFIGYLLADVSMMLHKYSEDEWLIAAISIYLDIINLFLYIVQLLNKCKRDA
jgi:protein lifeguard